MCRSKISVRDVETTDEKNEFLGGIHVDTADAVTTDPWVASIVVNERSINFKIDTEADVPVISNQDYNLAKDGPLSLATKNEWYKSRHTGCTWPVYSAAKMNRRKSYNNVRNLCGQWTH